MLVDILSTILPFRDNLLSHLIPKDITSLRMATGITLEQVERVKYMSILKLLPVKMSLIQRTMLEGGEIYILSADMDVLHKLLNPYDEFERNINVTVLILRTPTVTLTPLSYEYLVWHPVQQLTNVMLSRAVGIDIDIFIFDEECHPTDSKKYILRKKADESGLAKFYDKHIAKHSVVDIAGFKHVSIHNDPTNVLSTDYFLYSGAVKPNSYYLLARRKNIHISLGSRTIVFNLV